MRDLATVARTQEIQFIVSTHSSFVLNELPERARAYIINNPSGRRIVTGVSAEFAMTNMDEEGHPECDIYVEDDSSAVMLNEIIVSVEPDLSARVMFVPFGSASVGNSLGKTKSEQRFPKRTLVFLDGDQSDSEGCLRIPGEDAPERVVIGRLRDRQWSGIAERVGRGFSDTSDALNRSMSHVDHHEWPREAADGLRIGSDHLWQALCAEYALQVREVNEVKRVVQEIKDEIDRI